MLEYDGIDAVPTASQPGIPIIMAAPADYDRHSSRYSATTFGGGNRVRPAPQLAYSGVLRDIKHSMFTPQYDDPSLN